MGGRPLKPTALKVLKGTARKDRLNPSEPMPAKVKIPLAPAMNLGKTAMAEWTRITRELIEVNILTVIDYSMLEGYCYCFGKFQDAAILIEKDGMMKDGRPHPAMRIYKDNLELAHKIGMQFGITPSSRSKINAPTKPKDEPFDNV